jgi:hypothetical protein
MCPRRYLSPVVLSLAGVLWAAGTSSAQSASDNQGQNAARPVVRTATRTDVSAALRQMPQLPPAPAVLGEIFVRPRKLLPNREGSIAPTAPDPILQAPTEEPGAPTTGTDFEGVGNVNGVLPPDTVGDIGPNHYVQMVNLSFAIWNRSGNLIYGPTNNKTLWQGFGGPCETRNDGDPIVLYDHLADRWVFSQFALPNFPNGPFYQCLAVSQTPDPTGPWYRYEFLISQTKLNDYPKFGVWPDGYYMSINQFSCNFARCSWAGAGVASFERDKMLNGQVARMVYFDLYSVDPNLGGMLPSDLDGPAPPAGAPNPFAQIDDNAWGYSPDQVQIWNFHSDWANPSSSTFTKSLALATAAFDANMCGYARNCIPQRDTNVKVDALSDRLMHRLQYRNFGTHQTLVLNHTVDVSGSDRAGIRWYELRNSGSGWSIYQQGSFSPAADHRWMGSIAMNGNGDIGLGYSISSTGIYPSIRATGRLDGDTLGQMTQGEITIQDGSGYQTHSSGRWGDYSSLNVDPVDDCTFWYTQEYYAAASSAAWKTRIGSFKLRDCGAPPPAPTAPSNLQANAVSSSQINLTWADNSNNEDGFKVKRCSGSGCTPTTVIATLGANTTSYNNTGLSASTSYSYVVVAFNSGGDSGASNTASATTQAAAGISLTASGFKVKGVQMANLTWSGANSTQVDIFRNAVKLLTTANDGAETDNINKKGAGTYIYQVCEAGTATCSNQATVVF